MLRRRWRYYEQYTKKLNISVKTKVYALEIKNPLHSSSFLYSFTR